jgi:protein gp37
MGDKSAIEWTEATWNPVTGCSKVSPGCAHCYAETISLRFHRSVKPWTPANAAENVVLHPDRLDQPLRWRRPRMIFVNSMSDLFHEQVPDDYIDQVFRVMAEARQHTFQVLTKRPERARDWFADRSNSGWIDPRATTLAPLENVWLGVSIENARFTGRADVLREIPAAVRFISAEPLLGSLRETRRGQAPLDLSEIDWLIVGGESGVDARPMDAAWALELRDACAETGTAFFFKQWGGRTAKSGGRELQGRTYDEMPNAGAGAADGSSRSLNRTVVPGGYWQGRLPDFA